MNFFSDEMIILYIVYPLCSWLQRQAISSSYDVDYVVWTIRKDVVCLYQYSVAKKINKKGNVNIIELVG